VEVQLQPEDYVKASMAVAQWSWKSGVKFAGGMLAVLSVVVYAAMREGVYHAAFVSGMGTIGAVIGMHVMKWTLLPRKARRIFAQTPAMRRPYQVTWDERTMTSTSEYGSGTFPWAEFHKTRELAGQFLVFFSDVAFIMIPKRAFPDEFTLHDFRKCLQTGVRPDQH